MTKFQQVIIIFGDGDVRRVRIRLCRVYRAIQYVFLVRKREGLPPPFASRASCALTQGMPRRQISHAAVRSAV